MTQILKRLEIIKSSIATEKLAIIEQTAKLQSIGGYIKKMKWL